MLLTSCSDLHLYFCSDFILRLFYRIQYFVIDEEVLPHHSHQDSQFQNGKMYLSIYPGLVDSLLLNSKKNYPIDRLFCFCCLSDKIKMNSSNLLYNISTCSLEILFISFFLYFIIVRKSIRTFTTKMTVSKVTRKFHLKAAKKGSLIIVIMDI
jgi:hypothetical protein